MAVIHFGVDMRTIGVGGPIVSPDIESQFSNVPAELRLYNQWVLWGYAQRKDSVKPTKYPYQLDGTSLASVTDDNTWASFEDALEAYSRHKESGSKNIFGLGFVLSKADPFVFIDLDISDNEDIQKLHSDLKNAFDDTYMEFSPGGGVHILARGSIESGKRRYSTEIYDNDRYMTVTGNAIGEVRTISANHQPSIDKLWEMLGGKKGDKAVVSGMNEPERYPDDLLIEKASNAKNGEKFKALWAGDWKPLYPSQSDADQALVDMIGFYSENDIQIVRLFRRSELGKRDKALRDSYCYDMAKKSHDQKVPVIDQKIFMEKYAPKNKQEDDGEELLIKYDYGSDCPEYIPEGIIKSVFDFTMRLTDMPNPLYALCAGFAFMAGMAGRCYTYDDDGLNLYMLALGSTAVGKGQMKKALTILNKLIKKENPVNPGFIGSDEFTAKSSLLRSLVERPAFLSIFGEFHHEFKAWDDCNNPHAIGRLVKQLYSESSPNEERSTVAYADAKNKIPSIQSPTLSILGETVGSEFWKLVEDKHLQDGLINRFLIFDNTRKRKRNGKKKVVYMPESELRTIFNFAADCLLLSTNGRRQVEINPEAELYLKALEVIEDEKANLTEGNIERELYVRSVQNVKRIAALCAISRNHTAPVIYKADLEWGWNFVTKGIEKVVLRHKNHDIGASENSEIKQIMILKEVIYTTLNYTDKQMKTYGVDKEMNENFIITKSQIQNRLQQRSQFKQDKRRGFHKAMDHAFEKLVEQGILGNVDNEEMKKYNFTGKVYRVISYDLLKLHVNGGE